MLCFLVENEAANIVNRVDKIVMTKSFSNGSLGDKTQVWVQESREVMEEFSSPSTCYLKREIKEREIIPAVWQREEMSQQRASAALPQDPK